MAQKLTLHVFPDPDNQNKSAAIEEALQHVDKRELAMLIEMLADLKHDALESSKAAYGYRDGKTWDEDRLKNYKTNPAQRSLVTRFRKENYTFFLLKNEKDETVALMSGNAPHLGDKEHKQLRAMNITVARGHQEEGLVTELMKQVAHWAHDHHFDKIVIPLSRHAQAKDATGKNKVSLYQHVAKKLELPFSLPEGYDPAKPVDENTQQIEVTMTPQRFISLDPGMTSRADRGNTR